MTTREDIRAEHLKAEGECARARTVAVLDSLYDALANVNAAKVNATVVKLPDHQRDTMEQIRRSLERLTEEMALERKRWTGV